MRGRRRNEAGFTLIELLVSLSIFAIISVAVYSAFAGGIGVWRRAQEFGSLYQTARLVLDDMAQELRNAVMISGTGFVGEAQRLSFLTVRRTPFTSGRPAKQEITRVTYEMRRSQGSLGYSLLRLDAPYTKDSHGEGEREELMVGSLSKLEFQYTYKDKKGEILPWKEVWEVADELPLGVKIILVVGETRFTKLVFIPHGFQEKEDKPKF